MRCCHVNPARLGKGLIARQAAPLAARAVRLFDRTTGETRRAVDLPGSPESEIH